MDEINSNHRMATTGLVDLLDRVLGNGLVVTGDIIIALAGVDLLYLDLKVLLSPVDKLVSTLAAASDEESDEEVDNP